MLPMVILGILTLGYIIKINTLEEISSSIATDELRLLCMESYSETGKLNGVVFPIKLKERLNQNQPEGTALKVQNYKYLYSDYSKDNLISFTIGYDTDINFPIKFCDTIEGKQYYVSRAFVGKRNYRTEKGFVAMEEIEESEKVLIFPMSGEKYHDHTCTYVKSSTVKSVLAKAIKRKYDPCRLCDAKNMNEGEVVCYFPKSGEVYHKESCLAVDKYVIEVEKREAVQRGYTPCLKCGG